MTSQSVDLRPLAAADFEEVKALLLEEFGPRGGQRACQTLSMHLEGIAAGIDDGRRYYVCCDKDGDLVAITGLHHYTWGPSNCVWLGYLCVSAKMQRRGIATALMRATERTASEDFEKLYVETRASNTAAHAFYEGMGFSEAGRIMDYFDDGDMLCFFKALH